MSVRVNLLPEATKQGDRARQQRSIAGLAGVVLLAALGSTYLWASSQVSQAEEELAAEEARTSELRGEQAELIAFQDLADRREQALDTLTGAMADEVSAAGLLQDVAAVLPPDTQLDSLNFTVTPPAPDPPDDAAPSPAEVIATFNVTGQTLNSHAPGVERVLMSFGKIAGFRDLYLNSSTLDQETDEGIAEFSMDGQVGPEARTRRYSDGLPEMLR